MNNPTSEFLDIDLTRQDIQALSSADAVAAVLFRYYGLSEDDAKYIEKRLEEML
jgi:hypothetical protein